MTLHLCCPDLKALRAEFCKFDFQDGFFLAYGMRVFGSATGAIQHYML